MIRQRAIGLLALLLLLAALGGIPAALVELSRALDIGDPTLDGIQRALTQPDDGTALLTALLLLGWAAWAVFAVSVLVEIGARIRGVHAPSLPALRLPQQGAAALIGTVALLFAITPPSAVTPATHASPASAPGHVFADDGTTVRPGSNASTHSPDPSPPVAQGPGPGTQTSVSAAVRSAPEFKGQTAAVPSTESSAELVYVVQPGDSLWAIAEQHLGDGTRWHEIAALNQHLIATSRWLQPGWRLRLPTQTSHAGTTESHATAATVVVAPGDTLSALATQHLGNADQWPAIYSLNRDTIGPDADLILPGQQLTLPPPEATTQPSARTPEDDPRHHEHPNQHSGQPRNPSNGPGEGHKAGPRTPQLQSLETRPPGTAADPLEHGLRLIPQPPRTVEPGPGPASDAEPSSDGGARNDHVDIQQRGDEATRDQETSTGTATHEVTALRSLLASAFCLAAGLLALVVANRRRQLRHRRPGRAITTGAAESQAIERVVTETGDQPHADLVDTALRDMAAQRRRQQLPLPRLGAATLDRASLTLHLTEPAQNPPNPWNSADEGRTWTITLPTSPQPRGPAEDTGSADNNGGQPAPYPALVSVGEDAQGRTWLLDLESTGPRTLIESDHPDHYLDLVRFLTAELAVNAWSHGVEVLLPAALAADLDGINPHRITTADFGEMQRRASSRTRSAQAAVANLGRDVYDQRRDNDAVDGTTPLVLVHPPARPGAASSDSATQRSPLVIVAQCPSTSAAATKPATATDACLVLNSDGTATLPQWDVTLRPFTLTSGQARALTALVVTTADESEQAPVPTSSTQAPACYMNLDGSPRLDLVTPRQPDGDPDSLLPEPDQAYLDSAATTAEDLAALAPPATMAGRNLIASSDPTLDDDITAWFDPDTDRPKVTVLGPVDLHLADDTKLKTFRNRGGILEFIVYLACQEHGVPVERAADQLGWQTGTVQNRAGEARRALGVRDDGEDWLPDAQRSPAALSRGVATYQLLPEVLIDAELLRRLRLRAHARGSDGIEDLITALRLVEGEPFSQLRRNGYGWLTEGDRLDLHLGAAIADIGHLVVTHALQSSDLELARWAAQITVKGNPHADTAQLDLVAVMSANHDPQVREHLTDHVLDTHDEDPTNRTADLVDRKRWLAS